MRKRTRKDYAQAERIARIVKTLIEKGSKSYPELEGKFPNVSEDTIKRDVKLLKKVGLVVERKESRRVGGRRARKVFVFYKHEPSFKIEKAVKHLKEKLRLKQFPLTDVASLSGLTPRELEDAGVYEIVKREGVMIGSERIYEQSRTTVKTY